MSLDSRPLVESNTHPEDVPTLDQALYLFKAELSSISQLIAQIFFYARSRQSDTIDNVRKFGVKRRPITVLLKKPESRFES